jgi:histidinol-phosphatase (PHP family)
MSLRIFSDYHMHPQGHRHQPYTQDLLQPWADHCRAKGITDFALTDHDRYHAGVRFDEIARLNDNNPDLRIRAGIELDNDPETGAAGRAWVEKNWDRLDFVLGSVHYLAGKTKMFDSADQSEQFTERSVDEVYEDYADQVFQMIRQGHIDCLSHLDLAKIHGFRPERPALTYFQPLLDEIKKRDLSLEINTAGWRKPVAEQYPSREILAAAVARGIPLTFSSDAHSHVQPGEAYDRLALLVESLGIKEVALYSRHQRTLLPLI